jgi:valyl-tRNA synthetase
MCGDETVWVPGCDHAGIATQVVVERDQQRRFGLNRHTLGRPAFLEHVHTWKEDKEAAIHAQMQQLGASLDWDSVYFTLDAPRERAVAEVHAAWPSFFYFFYYLFINNGVGVCAAARPWAGAAGVAAGQLVV